MPCQSEVYLFAGVKSTYSWDGERNSYPLKGRFPIVEVKVAHTQVPSELQYVAHSGSHSCEFVDHTACDNKTRATNRMLPVPRLIVTKRALQKHT